MFLKNNDEKELMYNSLTCVLTYREELLTHVIPIVHVKGPIRAQLWIATGLLPVFLTHVRVGHCNGSLRVIFVFEVFVFWLIKVRESIEESLFTIFVS